jgi:nucleoid-associated protein YgaU
VASAAPAPSMMPSADTGAPVSPVPAPSISSEVVGPAVVGREPLLHIVKSGQTLEQIAEEYYKGGDKPYDQAAMVSLLRQANPQLADGKRLRAGTKMKIPDPSSLPIAQSAPSSSASTGHPTSPSVSGVAQAPVAPSLATMVQPVAAVNSPSTQTATVPSAGGREYKVQRGDTLYSIASRQLGSSKRWHDVLDLNSTTLGGKPEGLRPGQVLRLPG